MNLKIKVFKDESASTFALEVETAGHSETLITIHQTTHHLLPEDLPHQLCT